MVNSIQTLTQAVIDVMAWFLMPFAFVLVISWVINLFKRD